MTGRFKSENESYDSDDSFDMTHTVWDDFHSFNVNFAIFAFYFSDCVFLCPVLLIYSNAKLVQYVPLFEILP